MLTLNFNFMKKLFYFILVTSVVFFTGCDNGFENLAVDPNRPAPGDIETDLLLAATIRNTQAATYNVQQGGDMGLCWAQHWSKVQYNDEENYIPRRGAINGVWATLYASVIYDAKIMSNIAATKDAKNLQAIGLIVQANAYQILTDLYGPVPFSEAGIKGNLKPKYDTQEDVYKGIDAMLLNAISLLSVGTDVVNPTSDLVYAGNTNKWLRLANSLRFKALMRISDVVNVNAKLQAIIDGNNLMTSNTDSANIFNLADPAATNPIGNTLATRTEYKVSSVLVSNLLAVNDPRLAVFAKPVAGLFVGNIPGDESFDYTGKSAVGTFYQAPTLPGVILSYAQQELFIAEAAIEGKISGGLANAQTHFTNGVTANFLFNGLTAAAATTYLAQPSLAFTNAATGSPIIGKQMWIALYGQGFEAWTEWRRTKYPALLPAINADPTVPSIPSRLFYSVTEENNNVASVAAASALLPGGNKLTSKLWWML
jgi:Starch-binding associating with outer membrane